MSYKLVSQSYRQEGERSEHKTLINKLQSKTEKQNLEKK